MRKMFLLLSLGLLSACLALAQDASPAGQSTTPNADSSNTTTSAGQPAADDSNNSAGAIQGCLSGSDGNYMLTQDGTGASFKLMGDESKLKKHVGHEVSVTGQASGDAGSGSASNQGQGDTSSSGSAATTIQVTDVKMVSKQCMGSGGSQAH
jgi:hypothetical protein